MNGQVLKQCEAEIKRPMKIFIFAICEFGVCQIIGIENFPHQF
jgi:hypothetical protein